MIQQARVEAHERMKQLALAVLTIIATAAVSHAEEYKITSWHPKSRTTVVAVTCSTFADARRAASVLTALHELKKIGPHLDPDFVMITDSQEPLTTWVIQARQFYEPREYIYVGEKDLPAAKKSDK